MFDNEKQLVSLSSLSVGQKAVVVAFSIETEQGERDYEMGIELGQHLEIVRLPMQGEAIEIKIREYFVSLPKEDADRIKVKLVS